MKTSKIYCDFCHTRQAEVKSGYRRWNICYSLECHDKLIKLKGAEKNGKDK